SNLIAPWPTNSQANLWSVNEVLTISGGLEGLSAKIIKHVDIVSDLYAKQELTVPDLARLSYVMQGGIFPIKHKLISASNTLGTIDLPHKKQGATSNYLKSLRQNAEQLETTRTSLNLCCSSSEYPSFATFPELQRSLCMRTFLTAQDIYYLEKSYL